MRETTFSSSVSLNALTSTGIGSLVFSIVTGFFGVVATIILFLVGAIIRPVKITIKGSRLGMAVFDSRNSGNGAIRIEYLVIVVELPQTSLVSSVVGAVRMRIKVKPR